MKRFNIVIASCDSDLKHYQTVTQCFDTELQNLQNENKLAASATNAKSAEQPHPTNHYWKTIFPKNSDGCEAVLQNSQEITQNLNLSTSTSVFIPILTSQSTCDNRLNDWMSLAYLSNLMIVPISLDAYEKIVRELKPGIRMILCTTNWLVIGRDQSYTHTEISEKIRELVSNIENAYEAHQNAVKDAANAGGAIEDEDELDEEQDAALQESQHKVAVGDGFWTINFGTDVQEVSFAAFRQAFIDTYGDDLNKDFDMASTGIDWLLDTILMKEVFQLDSVSEQISRTDLLRFCRCLRANTNDTPLPHFYSRVLNYARSREALLEVFSMNSEVRLSVIQNMGNFSTPWIIRKLTQLLSSEDANLRAVACLALGKTDLDKIESVDVHRPHLHRRSVTLDAAEMREEKGAKEGTGAEALAGAETRQSKPARHAPTTASLINRDFVIRKLMDLLLERGKCRGLCQDRFVRESVIVALGKLNAQAAVDTLINIWRNDAISDVRRAAEISLGLIAGEKVQESLVIIDKVNKEIDMLKKAKNYV